MDTCALLDFLQMGHRLLRTHSEEETPPGQGPAGHAVSRLFCSRDLRHRLARVLEVKDMTVPRPPFSERCLWLFHGWLKSTYVVSWGASEAL